MDSILTSIKKLLGIDANYTNFDNDIIIHINSVFSVLFQLGIGDAPFKITGATETWSDFLGDETEIDDVKTYVYLRVRKLFDPPASSAVANAFDEQIKEFEFRINVAVDHGE